MKTALLKHSSIAIHSSFVRSNATIARSFPHRYVRTWNALPKAMLEDAPTLNGLQAFKIKVHKHLIRTNWLWATNVTFSVLFLSSVSFVSPLPSSVNHLFLLEHCLCNDAETTGRLTAGSPTTRTFRNSPLCDWSLDFVNKNKSRNCAEPAPRWLSHYIIPVRVTS